MSDIKFSKAEVRRIIAEEVTAIREAKGVDHERAAKLASLAADIASMVAKIREKVASDFPMMTQQIDEPLNKLSQLADDMQSNRANPNFLAPKREKKVVVLKPVTDKGDVLL